MPIRRTYWAIGLVFFMLLVFSHRRGSYANDDDSSGDRSFPPGGSQRQQQRPPPGGGGGDIHKKPPPGPPASEKPYTRDPAVLDNNNNNNPSATSFKPLTVPNTSNHYDSLIIIPTSWTQFQNRVWVRETLFGIKNNLEPCARYNGNIIYKFYIYGRSTWLKSGIYTAQYMQAQVRSLHGEFMEFDDWHFTNRTVENRHAVWGDALNWAVNTFVPQEKIKVDKVILFDSTSIVNVEKLENLAKQSTSGTSGLLMTWGETPTTPFAALISFPAATQILKSRVIIEENRAFMDLITAATLYYNSQITVTVKVVQGEAPLWQGDIDQVPSASAVIGMVHQLEDWIPLAQRIAVQPISPCAVDSTRNKKIAVLTSSYIYADMCMAEAALPSADNKRIYAEKHGHYFIARSAEFAQEEYRHRQRVWGKIGAIQKTLPHYEWLLWMDMDAIVANLDQDVREIIRKAEELNENKQNEVSIIVSRPLVDKMLNAGVMLIKNTDWSRRFLNEVQRRKTWYNMRPSYEQGAIWDVMRDDNWTSGVYLFDRDVHTMNTFPSFYKQGDFIVHFAPAGCPSVPVIQALGNIQSGDSIVGVGVEDKKVPPKAKAAVAA
ncbi:hypothetical protein BGZ96_001246 [Linnemannia gamsii]|uniref:Glycosyltransferase family 34 protein n=1 Tax=Linnemannia gamsii TaxID=64522 RepID=A0ABQ7KBV9_9FUNG|nr:hypothetical protein BGZ96_001246 [Linnemannia gamsii]